MRNVPEPVNSNNRAYQIYALIDPRDNLVHYVGISVNVQTRFIMHLGGNSVSRQERHWIADLKREGMSPTLRIIETVEASDNSHALACERELYWINEMLRLGHPLVNKLGVVRSYVPVTKYSGRRRGASVENLAPVPPPRKPQEKLLTVKQVADIMSVDEKTIRSWIQRGDLRAVNIGRLRPEYRIRPADLDEFISHRQTDRSDN